MNGHHDSLSVSKHLLWMWDAIPFPSSEAYLRSFAPSKSFMTSIRVSGVAISKYPSRFRWLERSAWWLSIRSALGTAIKSMPADRDSKILPAPAWEIMRLQLLIIIFNEGVYRNHSTRKPVCGDVYSPLSISSWDPGQTKRGVCSDEPIWIISFE